MLIVSATIILLSEYLESDIGLLGEKYSTQIAVERVLGNSLYGVSCSKEMYKQKEDSHSSGETVLQFEFCPIVGKELECPPVVVAVDRRTGEAWVTGRGYSLPLCEASTGAETLP
jgi:hypothetical protein